MNEKYKMSDDLSEPLLDEEITEEENIIGYDALFESAWLCKNGVLHKNSVAHYILNLPEETLKLERQLKSNTYVPRQPH